MRTRIVAIEWAGLGLGLLALCGCGAEPEGRAPSPSVAFDRTRAREALLDGAWEVGRAAEARDHARMAELTYPALVRAMGGPDAYVEKLAEIEAQAESTGNRLGAVAVSEEAAMVESPERVFGVVPTVIRLEGPGGRRGRVDSYLVGVSDDGGATWTYLGGGGSPIGRETLRKVFPDFPGTLEIPEVGPAVWEDGDPGA